MSVKDGKQMVKRDKIKTYGKKSEQTFAADCFDDKIKEKVTIGADDQVKLKKYVLHFKYQKAYLLFSS